MRLWDLSSKTCLKIFSHSDYGKLLEHCYFVHGILCPAFSKASNIWVCWRGGKCRVFAISNANLGNSDRCCAGSHRTNIFMLCMVYCIRLENIARRWQLGLGMSFCLVKVKCMLNKEYAVEDIIL